MSFFNRLFSNSAATEAARQKQIIQQQEDDLRLRAAIAQQYYPQEETFYQSTIAAVEALRAGHFEDAPAAAAAPASSLSNIGTVEELRLDVIDDPLADLQHQAALQSYAVAAASAQRMGYWEEVNQWSKKPRTELYQLYSAYKSEKTRIKQQLEIPEQCNIAPPTHLLERLHQLSEAQGILYNLLVDTKAPPPPLDLPASPYAEAVPTPGGSLNKFQELTKALQKSDPVRNAARSPSVLPLLRELASPIPRAVGSDMRSPSTVQLSASASGPVSQDPGSFPTSSLPTFTARLIPVPLPGSDDSSSDSEDSTEESAIARPASMPIPMPSRALVRNIASHHLPSLGKGEES